VDRSVVIVGSGAAGLALACELAAAGVPCTVLERSAEPPPPAPAVLLHSRTLEDLDLRGHAGPLLERAQTVARMRLGVGAPALDFGGLDSRFPGLHVLPGQQVLEVLEQRALALGARIRRGVRVRGLTQDADGVRLLLGGDEAADEVADEVPDRTADEVLTAGYAVGCDDGPSCLRDLAGIGFPGRKAEFAPVLADVRLRQPPPDDVLVLPGRGGVLVTAPAGDGWYRIALVRGDHAWSEPLPTETELARALTAMLGFDPGLTGVRGLTRPRGPQRLADRYRSGRVLLVGPAAHRLAPPAGQELNLGLQDAVNLGWKLAAVLSDWSPPELLDSYQDERRPLAVKALRRAERAARHLGGTSVAAALLRRAVLAGLLGTPSLRQAAATGLAGLGTRYPRGSGRASRLPLHAGQRLPELVVRLRQGPPALAPDLLDQGRFLLIDFGHQGIAATAAERGWGDRVRTVSAIGPLEGYVSISTLLIRPDGYLAWADDSYEPPARISRAKAALTRWCGPATSGPASPGPPAPTALIQQPSD